MRRSRAKRGVRGAALLVLFSFALMEALASSGGARVDPSHCDLPPDEQPPIPTEPVDVCGTTILRGSEAGFVRIRLAEQVSFTTDNQGEPDADVQMEGVGPFIGFAILSDLEGPDLDGPGVVLGRYPLEAYPHRFVGTVLGGLANCRPCELPAGDYLLYLLADQTETTITLRFESLPGRIELTPQTPVPFRARYQVPQFPEDESKTHYLAGSAGELTSEGIVWTAVWARMDLNLDQRWVVGLHYSEPSLYMPQCEGANQRDQYAFNELNLQDPLAPREHGHAAIWRVNEPGRYALCDWALLAANASRVDAIGIWWSVWPLVSPAGALGGQAAGAEPIRLTALT